jgi:alpha-L-arabinofuranosidase
VDWPVNLINFDAAKSFGRISYYAIKLFSDNRADVNLSTAIEINKVAVDKPMFTGGIGFGTWDTQSEFKDVEVIQNGKIVYKSNFINNAGEWDKIRGSWIVKDSALAQTAEGPQRLVVLNNKTFDTYTLKLKARRTGGLNAFMIPFAVKDSNTYMRAHIGSWWNAACVFEKVENGYEVAGLTDQKRLAQPMETGKWYDVRLEVGLDKIDCYLNDTLLMSYQEPKKLFALAGRDETNGDIILKVVNAKETVFKTTINLDGITKLDETAQLTTLSADELKAENSFSQPKKYIPQQEKIVIGGRQFEMEWRPFSINILRIKDSGWKK